MKTILAITRRISDHLRKYRAMPSTNIQEIKSRLLMLSLVTGLLMASAQWAAAQPTKLNLPPPPPIEIPIGTPDLVVTVDAPTALYKYGHGYVFIYICNALTPKPHPILGSVLAGSPVNNAELLVRFAGLKPLKIIDATIPYHCTVAGFIYVWCNGPIGAGDTVGVQVEVEEIGGSTGTGG